MGLIKLPEEECEALEALAHSKGLTVQELIRRELLGLPPTPSPQEIAQRARACHQPGEPFTLPALLGNDWPGCGKAGVLGRLFFKYVKEEGQDEFEFIGVQPTGRHHAVYQLKVRDTK